MTARGDIMHINKMILLMALAVLPLAFTGCEKKEETKTVDWYMAPENQAAFEAKLKECRNNPGELGNTPNCQNAELANHKLFVTRPAKPLKF